jgi:hypothetical protein
MPLPYTYKSKIEIPESEALETKEVLSKLESQLVIRQLVSDFNLEDEKISFNYKALFNIKYPVEITVKRERNSWIYYEAKLMKLIQLSLGLVMFVAFFSSFEINGFLWFSAIFTLIFFTINVLYIENGIQKLLKSNSLFKNIDMQAEEQFSKEQLKWMNDTNKCPACGEDLQPYDQNCPECGLRLPRKPIAKPFDVSKYENKRLSYSYKAKKNIEKKN